MKESVEVPTLAMRALTALQKDVNTVTAEIRAEVLTLLGKDPTEAWAFDFTTIPPTLAIERPDTPPETPA